MNESYKKLVKTLQTIFEMDKADLDFGIYRIMNQKRDDINRFLEEDLLTQVKQAFEDYSNDGQGDLEQELAEAIEQAKRFGAPDPENAPAVLDIKARMANSVDATVLENDVFSKLQTFFSRYYDQGDFISQRRYKADTYSIPYEGEEVKLYWANHDQYYIKSSEHLRDYAFVTKEETGEDQKTVRIKLKDADTEKDNIKAKAGEERRFVLDEELPLSEENGELLIHFNFIPAGKKKQAKLNEAAATTIFEQEGFDDWLAVLKTPMPTEKNKDRTLLDRHLNEYTARNTFDYFIHKDLGGFLNRELDFYIKNEVLFLDDIDDAAFSVTEQQLRKIKIIRTIAKKIIRMLAQLENFQKKLWLKKKFVVETNYCITIDRIPFNEKLFEEIFSNEKQLTEWEELFSINREQLVKDYNSLGLGDFIALPYVKYLSVDTRFFDREFKDCILSGIEDISFLGNGLIIEADNFQGLNLIKSNYKSSVDCIHIDPPYNTDTSGFLYKNSYKHSSWLSLMSDRLSIARSLLKEGAPHITHIDENEYEKLAILFENLGFASLGTLIWDKGSPVTGKVGLATQHEYILWNATTQTKLKSIKRNAEEMYQKSKEIFHSFGSDKVEMLKKWRTWIKGNNLLSKAEKIYDQIDENGEIFRSADMTATDKRANSKFHIPLIHPISGKDCPVPKNGWRYTPETIERLISKNEILFGENEDKIPRRKIFLKNNLKSQMPTMLTSGFRGKSELDALGLEFPFAHSSKLYKVLLDASESDAESPVYLDYFAGSGTTMHSVFTKNREEVKQSKFIMIDAGEQVYTAIVPRAKKLAYSNGWKAGKPVNTDGIPTFIKYIKLEGYEDALNNLSVVSTDTNKDLLESNQALKEDYMLGYWLDVETADSPSLLNVQQFEDPFNYKLNIGSGSVGATKATKVDLVETFNYLIGLTVKTIDVIKGVKLVTGTNPQGDSVLVVWRKVKDIDNTALESFLEKQGYNPRDTEFDHIYVNGDHTLEDPQSKVKMTEIEFKRLMFDVSDV